MRQKTELEITLHSVATGEARSADMEGTETRTADTQVESQAAYGPLMEVIVERDNLRSALAHVKRNKGAAGIDGMSLDALAPHLKEHWPAIRAQLLEGTYKPQPVRRVEIPKASGGTRSLGIPTVLDRFIQQAVLQVLQAEWDPTFSEHSFGFRPKRSAHQAVARAQELIASGHGIVVDIDGVGGETGGRQGCPEADPRFSDRRRADGWAGRSDGRGDPARGVALAAAVKPDAGCAGQGT